MKFDFFRTRKCYLYFWLCSISVCVNRSPTHDVCLYTWAVYGGWVRIARWMISWGHMCEASGRLLSGFSSYKAPLKAFWLRGLHLYPLTATPPSHHALCPKGGLEGGRGQGHKTKNAIVTRLIIIWIVKLALVLFLPPVFVCFLSNKIVAGQ